MSFQKRVLAALQVAKATWLFSLMKSGADELGITESRFDSSEWVEVEKTLDELEPVVLKSHEQAFWELREYVCAGQEAMDGLCYLLECQMATLEYALSVKRTPKTEKARHRAIIEKGVIKVVRLEKRGFAIPQDCPRILHHLGSQTDEQSES